MVALLSWLGVPAVVALVSSLGFTLVSPLIISIMLAALALVTAGLWLGLRSHGRPEPLLIGGLGAIATVVGMVTWGPVALMRFLVVAGAIGVSQLYLRGGASAELSR